MRLQSPQPRLFGCGGAFCGELADVVLFLLLVLTSSMALD